MWGAGQLANGGGTIRGASLTDAMKATLTFMYRF
jgi:hypothetical protein